MTGGCSLVGDDRGDENIALHSMHTVWVREHNRIAKQIKRFRPNWSGERIFQTARKINVAQLQHIVYTEFLPPITKLSPYRGYKQHVNPHISNAFATAAFRFGHSLVPHSFAQLNKGFNRLHRPIVLRDAFLTRRTINNRGIEPTMFGLMANKTNPVDNKFAFGLARRLMVKRPSKEHADLTAFNIQRGRDHGLPKYGKWREFCGLNPIKNAGQVNRIMRNGMRNLFDKLQLNINHVDLFPAGISERPVKNRIVGPTFGCIIKEQFERLRDADRYFYLSRQAFSLNQIRQVKKSSIARVLCNNLYGIVSIGRKAFRSQNNRVACGRIKQLNIRAFL